MNKVNWGILGTGQIAELFARGLTTLSDANLLAVGSRTRQTAEKFGDTYNISRRYYSYEELATDPDLDVIYIATPHNLHHENSMTCLEHGKAVLCEKPFTINAALARQVIKKARKKRLFLMEAMWTRFFPIHIELRRLLGKKTIGDVRMIMADFGFKGEINLDNRLYNPHLGGGALLDVGIYPVSLSSMVFGAPSRIASMAHMTSTNVDEQIAVILGHGNGQLAVLTASIRTDNQKEAYVIGTKGRIKIHSPWHCSEKMTLFISGKKEETIHLPYTANGYNYEAAEVMKCLNEGKIESDIMSLDETLVIMETMDRIRELIGLKYPMETF
ncbi:MAG: Gfo/Idh/MocA family protein [Candidatus Odinarchaeota archaeon]